LSRLENAIRKPHKSPVVILLLKPNAINIGFTIRREIAIKGINNMAVIFKLIKTLTSFEQLGQCLVFSKLFNTFENKPIFCVQCGHFIVTSLLYNLLGKL